MQPDQPNNPGKTPGAAETGGGSGKGSRQDPGKTPGTAEGERQTVEQDQARHDNKQSGGQSSTRENSPRKG